MKITNYLLGYKDLYIVQDTEMFNFSLDSVLLANFVPVSKNTNNILDIGCGNAPIPIILSTKTNAKIIGIEIQNEVFDLALESVNINSLQSQIHLINADINDEYKKFKSGSFDLITCNPPFFKYDENSNINESKYKTIARHEIKLNISQLMQIAKYLLKNGGIIDIVHRPERITDVIIEMKKNGIEPKRIQFVYPHIGSNANIMLIEGIKNGRPGAKLLKPLVSHEQDGGYTKDIKVFFENN